MKMKKHMYVLMFILFAGSIYSVAASNNFLEIQTGGGYLNITNEGNINRINCWDSNYFKYELSTDCGSNAANLAVNSCQSELTRLVNERNDISDENKELRSNNTYLINKLNELQNSLDEKTNKLSELEDRQDTTKTDQTACEKDLAVCKTQADNEKENTSLNVVQNIFIGILIAMAVIVYVIVRFRKDKGDKNIGGQNISERRPQKSLDNEF